VQFYLIKEKFHSSFIIQLKYYTLSQIFAILYEVHTGLLFVFFSMDGVIRLYIPVMQTVKGK